MKKFTLLFLMATLAMAAQEKKYQSLLWEISGNGLAKKSYLYGSMHVSDKVSYNLSDAFFEHLLNADMVAGESDPATWPEFSDILNPSTNKRYSASLYASFYLKPLTRDGLNPLFASNSFTLNGMLTRTNERRQENQEETYLDMFIYRTGKKNGKKTLALEDTKKSLLTLSNLDASDMAMPEINRGALQKILKNIPPQDAFMNFYREKDLDMMDTLAVLTSPQPYLKALLYDRNIIMVRSIDSLAHRGSVFAAVGAAHLPGNKGIIEALRKLGYTVNPVHSAYTQKGIVAKQKIESTFLKPAYKQYTTTDGMVSLPLFNVIMENGQGAESPDLTNGGYITLKRLALVDFAKKDNKPFDSRTLDSLFYENIKGRIIDKKTYTYNDCTVYDIKNTTKTGNAQHYRYYVTPLEVIAVIMSGERDYVRRYEDDIFNNITVKPVNTNWNTIEPKNKGVKAQLPAYYITYGGLDKAAPENIDVFAANGTARYFLLERTLEDSNELEDSEFELKRMHYEFYTSLKTDSTNTAYAKAMPASFTSSAPLGKETIRLKSLLNGPKYYLLGTIGGNEKDTERFFSSFTITNTSYTGETMVYTDKNDGYSITLPKKQNAKLEFTSPKTRLRKDEKINLFIKRNRYNSFVMPSGAGLNYQKYQTSRYQSDYTNDSIFAYAKKLDGINYADDYDYSDSEILRQKGIQKSQWNTIFNQDRTKRKVTFTAEEKHFDTATNNFIFKYLIKKDGAGQAVKKQYYYHNGTLHSLSAMVPVNYSGNDKPLEEAFDSFKFTASGNKGETTGKDKLKLFMDDMQSEADSIRYSAINSAYFLDITDKDLPALISFMKAFEFKADEFSGQTSLLQKIGDLDIPASVTFLEEEYKKDNVTAGLQFSILATLASTKNKEAYKKILELMEYDLPLTDDTYAISSLFTTFMENPEKSTVLFPDIFQFYSVKEYHSPIINLAAKLLDEKTLKPAKLKSFKKMLLTNAKLELKREKNRKSDDGEENYATYEEDEELEVNPLTSFTQLLYPFRKEKTIAAFFNDVKALDSKEMNLELARLDAVNGEDSELLERLLQKPETMFKVYNIADVKNDVAAARKITLDQLALSAIYSENNVKEEDSVTMFSKRIETIENYKVTFYFYTIEKKDSDKTGIGNIKMLAGIAFVNNSDGTINTLAYKLINPNEIVDDEKIEEIIKTEIDRIRTINNTRTNSDFNEANRSLLYDDFNYDD